MVWLFGALVLLLDYVDGRLCVVLLVGLLGVWRLLVACFCLFGCVGLGLPYWGIWAFVGWFVVVVLVAGHYSLIVLVCGLCGCGALFGVLCFRVGSCVLGCILVMVGFDYVGLFACLRVCFILVLVYLLIVLFI